MSGGAFVLSSAVFGVEIAADALGAVPNNFEKIVLNI
jgi:hypothetical protein